MRTSPVSLCFLRQTRRGFTLVELVLVIATMGILAGAASVRFTGALMKTRADAAAKRIKADLTWARQQAIAGSSSITVEFTPATDSYGIPALNDPDHSSSTYNINLNAAPYSTTLVSAGLGGDSDVIFDRYGQPDSGGTILVQAGNFQQTITIDPDTGKAAIP